MLPFLTRLLFAFSLLLVIFPANAQNKKPETWVAFSDSVTEMYGYKDLQGNVKIPPRYLLVETDTFNTIAFVLDKEEGFVAINKELKTLFKPFIYDNSTDAFSSGLIRITDKNKKIGFADSSGKIVISPQYDLVLPFNDNFTAFYSGGKERCADGDLIINCEHFVWVGGKWGIINKANDTIVNPSLSHEEFAELNLASLTATNPNSGHFVAFLGKSKTYYIENVRFTFQGFFQTFLAKAKALDRAYFTHITYSNLECAYCLGNTNSERKALRKKRKRHPNRTHEEERAAEVIATATFVEQDLALIFSPKTMAGLADTSRTSVFIDYQRSPLFYANPGSAYLKEITPGHGYYIIEVVLSHYTKKRIRFQEQFDFIKTSAGFKFIRYDNTL